MPQRNEDIEVPSGYSNRKSKPKPRASESQRKNESPGRQSIPKLSRASAPQTTPEEARKSTGRKTVPLASAPQRIQVQEIPNGSPRKANPEAEAWTDKGLKIFSFEFNRQSTEDDEFSPGARDPQEVEAMEMKNEPDGTVALRNNDEGCMSSQKYETQDEIDGCGFTARDKFDYLFDVVSGADNIPGNLCECVSTNRYGSEDDCDIVWEIINFLTEEATKGVKVVGRYLGMSRPSFKVDDECGDESPMESQSLALTEKLEESNLETKRVSTSDDAERSSGAQRTSISNDTNNENSGAKRDSSQDENNKRNSSGAKRVSTSDDAKRNSGAQGASTSNDTNNENSGVKRDSTQDENNKQNSTGSKRVSNMEERNNPSAPPLVQPKPPETQPQEMESEEPEITESELAGLENDQDE